jgi:uncharacterized protein
MNAAAPLSDAELTELEQLLDSLPAPLEPLDISALDGYLCGVLLQPQPVPASQWLRWVGDVEGQALPPGPQAQRLATLAQRRHAELEQAIAQRQWFDPWVFPPGDDAREDDPVAVQQAMRPWVAGFAAAMEAFPGLADHPSPALIEPLALLYLHFDPADLEDADALLAVIETIEPPADLAEAVQDAVRALMLMADVTRPRPARPGAGQRPGGTPGSPARRRQGGRSSR